MRRLLILGVAATTALLSVAATAAPVLASQHTNKARIQSCSDDGTAFLSVVAKGTTFYLGTPNKITSTSVAILKPAQNGTTLWEACTTSTGAALIQKSGGKWYALTSRSTAVGADVSLQAVTNNGTVGTAFMSQIWTFGGSNPITFQNQLTKLYLRVRNSGPKMYQTVTTGLTPEGWTAG